MKQNNLESVCFINVVMGSKANVIGLINQLEAEF